MKSILDLAYGVLAGRTEAPKRAAKRVEPVASRKRTTASSRPPSAPARPPKKRRRPARSGKIARRR